MKVLIRNFRTGLYLADRTKIPPPSPGQLPWTNDPEKAHDFKLIDRVAEWVSLWRLEHVEIGFGFNLRGSTSITVVPLEKAVGVAYAQ